VHAPPHANWGLHDTTHEPAEHVAVIIGLEVVQAALQSPQFALSFPITFKHGWFATHALNPALHTSVHLPEPLHVPVALGSILEHALPQVPQLLLSFCRFVHDVPPQSSGFAEVVQTHDLAMQVRPPAHFVLQLPQLLLSVLRSTQRPLQYVLNAGAHCGRHAPFVQLTPTACGSFVVQCVLQLPQWFVSDEVSTHAGGHESERLSGHAHAPAVQTWYESGHAAPHVLPQLFFTPLGSQIPEQHSPTPVPVKLHAAPSVTHRFNAAAAIVKAPPPLAPSRGLALAPTRNVFAAADVLFSSSEAGLPAAAETAVGTAHVVLVHAVMAWSTIVHAPGVAVTSHAAFAGIVTL
jgi:hypothetical protein